MIIYHRHILRKLMIQPLGSFCFEKKILVEKFFHTVGLTLSKLIEA
jgi:hypothetical protein